MSGFDFFMDYTAVKLHFAGKYDYFKYHGKIKHLTPESFERRKDKYMFHKLAKTIPEAERVPFLVSNFLQKEMWTRELLQQKAIQVYEEWKVRQKNLIENFETDLKKIIDDSGSLQGAFYPKGGNLPQVLVMYMRKDICLETLVMFDLATGCVDRWDLNIKDDIIYPKIATKITKYAPFLSVDLEQVKRIIKSYLT